MQYEGELTYLFRMELKKKEENNFRIKQIGH